MKLFLKGSFTRQTAISILLLTIGLSQAQTTNNGNLDEINELEKNKIKYANEIRSFELFTENFAKEKIQSKSLALPDTSCVAIIPVVFHVFHPNNAVTLAQINYAINDLNRTFAGTDADYTTVNAAFSSVKSYTKIRFALAKTDPNGNATTGVVFYKDKQVGYANSPQWDNEISSISWDNFKYFNVYLMNDLFGNNVTNNSGFCFYPSTSQSNSGLARMVYNYTYLGQGGTSFNNLEFNQTFTHECGHYMNLLHTFEGNNCAGTGDFCNDTPPTSIAGAGCSATVCSNLINAENYMDYNASCYKNFTMDQNTRMEAALQHPARLPLWQYDNLVATGIINPATTNTCVNASPFLAFSKTKLNESLSNNGSIDTPPIIIYACGSAQFQNVSQTLVQGTDYTISNLPLGLTSSIVTSSNGKTATLTLVGQAAFHSTVNTVSNVNLVFTNAAVVGGSVTGITNYSKNLTIKFYDPWKLTCVNPTNISANASTTLSSFQTTGPVPKNYSLVYNSGSLLLQNYGRGIITTAINSDNISFLTAGTPIGPSSSWRTGGNPGVLYSNSYTALDGQSGYVGFRMQIGTDYYYGYMTVNVSSATGATVTEYVYNNKPNDPILAGTNCVNVGLNHLSYEHNLKVFPNPANDQITFHLTGDVGNLLIKNISIKNIIGQHIQTVNDINSARYTLNINGLNNGIYIATIETDKETFNLKFIKE